MNAEEPVACAAGDVDAGLVGVKWSGLPVGFRRRRPPRNRRVVCGLIELEKQRNYDAMSVTIWGLKRCHQRFGTEESFTCSALEKDMETRTGKLNQGRQQLELTSQS